MFNSSRHISCLLTDSELSYLADKVFVHRWPHDTPIWGDHIIQSLDERINKNPDKKHITVSGKTIQVENFEFHSLKKLGISVPFFKRDCRMIFESQFDGLYAHVHIITKSDDFLDVFNKLMAWKQTQYSD